MKVQELKEALSQLGAKTTGSKEVLERRLAIWQKSKLNRTLFTVNTVPVNPYQFPEPSVFQPLNTVCGKKIVDFKAIEAWFTDRSSKKGLQKGRILAIQQFVKYTQVYVDGAFVYVKANCCAEQKKMLEYPMQLLIANENKSFCIKQCNCSCPAGTGWSAACKHIGALCFSLEHFTLTGKVQEYASCTSQPLTWNKPTGRGVEYMSIYEITKQNKENYVTSANFSHYTINKLINLGIQCPLANSRKSNLEDYIHDHGFYTKPVDVPTNRIDGEETRDTLLSIIFENSKKSEIMIYLATLVNYPLRKCCFNFYEETIKCRDVVKTCKETSFKINKENWHKERQYRITGSRCYGLYTYNGGDWELKSCKYFWPKKFVSGYTDHGIAYEPQARETYSKNLGRTVVECGVVISANNPFLAYTPDGIIVENGIPIKLLEIKCPIKGLEVTAGALFENSQYLKFENDRIVLNRKHIYYGQVQLGMAILNLPECDFIVFSPFDKTFLNIIVPFDKNFAVDLVTKLKGIYFNNMLHAICINKI